MKPNKFGERLTLILKTLDMSQIELAHRTGLTPAAISQILACKREPTLSTICLILEVVPVKFEALVKP